MVNIASGIMIIILGCLRGIGEECPKSTEYCYLESGQPDSINDEKWAELCKVGFNMFYIVGRPTTISSIFQRPENSNVLNIFTCVSVLIFSVLLHCSI